MFHNVIGICGVIITTAFYTFRCRLVESLYFIYTNFLITLYLLIATIDWIGLSSAFTNVSEKMSRYKVKFLVEQLFLSFLFFFNLNRILENEDSMTDYSNVSERDVILLHKAKYNYFSAVFCRHYDRIRHIQIFGH